MEHLVERKRCVNTAGISAAIKGSIDCTSLRGRCLGFPRGCPILGFLADT